MVAQNLRRTFLASTVISQWASVDVACKLEPSTISNTKDACFSVGVYCYSNKVTRLTIWTDQWQQLDSASGCDRGRER